MVDDVKGIGHMLKKPKNNPRRKISEGRRKLLNTPRYIKRFEVLEEEHCKGVPVVVFQISGKSPAWRICPKCLLIIEEEIDR